MERWTAILEVEGEWSSEAMADVLGELRPEIELVSVRLDGPRTVARPVGVRQWIKATKATEEELDEHLA